MPKSSRFLSSKIRNEIRSYSQKDIKNIINMIMSMSKHQLKDSMDDDQTSCIELAIGAVMIKAIREGDTQALNFLLDRSVGKVKEVINVEIPPRVEYITEVNADGNLVQSVIESGPKDERDMTIDIDPLRE